MPLKIEVESGKLEVTVEETSKEDDISAEMFQPAIDAPSHEELAEYYGMPKEAVKEEEISEKNENPVLSLEDAKNLIPAKSQALMHELFRAELSKVQRINPKKIR